MTQPLPLPPESSDPLADAARRTATEIEQILNGTEDASLDPAWAEACAHVREFATRPGKRLRPALCALGYQLVSGERPPDSVWRFAGGLELVHTFMLVHDDVADAADLRRGGVALHHLLGRGKAGEDRAVVAGDHLFALGIETMLGCGALHSASATRWFLQVCRQTAAGQFLDLTLDASPLPDLNVFRAVKVAHLKTARYGFVAPLVTGAMLAGAEEELISTLERIGRHAGLAYQLVDDLIGLYGDPRVTGKSVDTDVEGGKRTFPVLAAWLRAPAEDRARLETLMAPGGVRSHADCDEVRELVARNGGRAATLRAIARNTRAARRATALLPANAQTRTLELLVERLAHRVA